jgi:hypothetical protein
MRSASSVELPAIALVMDGDEEQAGAGERGIAGEGLAGEVGAGLQAGCVEEFRGHGADRRVQAPGFGEQQAAVGGDGGVAGEEVFERGDFGAFGVAALEWLIELLGVPEQDDVVRGLGDGEDVGEGHLPGFVDEQQVDGRGHVFARPQPRGTGGDLGGALV